MKILAFLLALFLLGGCSQKSTVFVNDITFEEEVEQTYTPEPPQTVGFSEDSTWTGWNKFWAASAIGGQAADVWSTKDALSGTKCSEANPIYGDDPSVGKLLLVKGVFFVMVYTYTEWYLDGQPEAQQNYRNWFNGILAVGGFGATAWNTHLDCN